ncbi:MAG TPA: nucleoside transporter C-terminal domain-containing protein [Longimicrobium sp.]|nr:nucleoside transporter C-terminal domain-containing protein [Longimicrobium sp.]HEX6040302.1 nucleoside transporter C-terminal domain-containing protein [Longimicrobium sp.]
MTRSLKWLLPLWLAAALLLGAGLYAHAQQPETTAPQPAAGQPRPANPAEPAPQGAQATAQPGDVTAPIASPEALEKAQTPQSGIAADSQPANAGQAARQARQQTNGTPVQKAISFLGLLVFTGIAYLLSVHKKAVDWKLVAWGLILQFVFALLILKTPWGAGFFDKANTAFNALIGYTVEGARFLFGNLTASNIPVGPGGALPAVDPVGPTTAWASAGAFFAFNVLPTIIFFSSLMTLLYHLGVMQAIVKAFAWVMMRTMKISGAESLSTAGNIFLGQTEAPLLVKPFIGTMTKSEMHCIMVGGFGTVAGGVLAAYVGFLVTYFPDIAGHLISASVMAAPACLAISKIMYPETEEPVTAGSIKIKLEKVDANVIDAAARGASEGLSLALNVGAMLIAFIALVALLNGLLGWGAGFLGLDLTIQKILGWLCAPFAWLMGVPSQDALAVGTLLGEKTALNEFVAYAHLGTMLQEGAGLDPRSVVLATYALCGFANFSSIAIQIGGIGGMAPERRADLSRLGLRAMIAGTLANFMTACVVGILI